MKITPDPEFRKYLIGTIRQREFHERTGVHCSDLIYCINKQAWRKSDPTEDTDEQTLLYSIGWATQRWLTGKDEDEPEVERDGIIVTPDALYDSCPWELKATYASSAHPIEDTPAYVRQVMAQCFVTGTLTARLSRFEIMGNWKWVYNRSPKPDKLAELVAEFGENWAEHPTLQAWKFEFTQPELDKFWEWMKDRRDKYLAVLGEGVQYPKPIALAPAQEFECNYCPYTERCQ